MWKKVNGSKLLPLQSCPVFFTYSWTTFFELKFSHFCHLYHTDTNTFPLEHIQIQNGKVRLNFFMFAATVLLCAITYLDLVEMNVQQLDKCIHRCIHCILCYPLLNPKNKNTHMLTSFYYIYLLEVSKEIKRKYLPKQSPHVRWVSSNRVSDSWYPNLWLSTWASWFKILTWQRLAKTL